ncbi:MAG: hypothetical protein HRT89_20715 [Lentisphaeria bacterium]|nr:hypothetical protein [Lentisphaeria bacterium]NQZ70483.1 hypothetical protein [Lentisphaeria bacterium]
MTPESYFTGEPLRIGNTTQLLLDNGIIEDAWAITRTLEQPNPFPGSPLIVADKPWEHGSVGAPSVLFDEEMKRYRCWYQVWSMPAHSAERVAWVTGKYHHSPTYSIHYAESEDGIHWEKPLLDVCPHEHYGKTNMVYKGTHFQRAQGIQVIRQPEAPPEKRFMMVVLEKAPDSEGQLQSGVHLAYSPDGFSWTLDAHTILDYHSDCFNHIVHDAERGRWLLYCRPIQMYAAHPYGGTMPDGKTGSRHTKRRIAVATSTDLVNWSYPRTVLFPDERDTPDYNQCHVFRCASHFIMLYQAMNGDTDGSGDVRLAYSRDGLNFERFHDRKALIPRGPEGSWSAGATYSSCGPVAHGDNMLLYYSASDQPESSPTKISSIGAVLLRRDRFAACEAGSEPGFLLTREFILEGDRLILNARGTAVPGEETYLKVEICQHPPLGKSDGFTQACEGFEMENCRPTAQNGMDIPVLWKGTGADLSRLKGQPVYLRFQIKNCSLFSFRIEA